jgi:hypothetical protein
LQEAIEHDLKRSLQGSPFAWLIQKIDWKATPRRSKWMAVFWIVVAVLSFPLVITASFGLMFWLNGLGHPTAEAIPDGADAWAKFLRDADMTSAIMSLSLDFWPAFVTATAGALIMSWAVASAGRELSKFPETALFGTKAPNLTARTLRFLNRRAGFFPCQPSKAGITCWLDLF